MCVTFFAAKSYLCNLQDAYRSLLPVNARLEFSKLGSLFSLAKISDMKLFAAIIWMRGSSFLLLSITSIIYMFFLENL
jgi:hypothetical protein